MMRFFLLCKCAYRNNYTLTGILLVLFFLPANYIVFTAPTMSTEPYLGLRIALTVVTGLFCLFGVLLVAFTGAGDASLHAYDTAKRIYASNEDEFMMRLGLTKRHSVEVGWQLAAEELGIVLYDD